MTKRNHKKMKPLNRMQSIAFIIGAVLMVTGVGCVVFGLIPKVTAVCFAVGTATFTGMEAWQRYRGGDPTLRRLTGIMMFGNVCFVLSALLMLENVYQWVYPLFTSSIDLLTVYVRYIHNNWVVPLLVGAILQIYTMHRISHEMAKK